MAKEYQTPTASEKFLPLLGGEGRGEGESFGTVGQPRTSNIEHPTLDHVTLRRSLFDVGCSMLLSFSIL